MANNNDCDVFNDVYEKPRDNAPKAELDALKARNDLNARIYFAVKKVLEKNFSITGMPPDPEKFPGGLKGDPLAQVAAILGIIHADNWQDPSNGKTSPNTDDMQADDKHVIDRRFIDAVVDAVKSYTSSSDLYKKIFHLMVAEAGQGVSPAPSSPKEK